MFTLLSNLIYLAFQELVSLRVGCLIACSRGSHHLLSKLSSCNQVISFLNCCFSLFPWCPNDFVISFYYCPKYINSIKKRENKRKSRSKRHLFVSTMEN